MPGFSLSWGMVAILATVALGAGFLDAIAGGGGLIVLPALLLAGFDPASALGVNKLQAAFGSGSATLTFARAGLIHWREAWPMALMSGLGAIGGAALVGALPIGVLQMAMPILLVSIALYMGLSRRPTDQDRHRRLSALAFTVTLAPLIGFYDGLFGPGTGTFFMMAFVALLGFGIVRATGHAKLLNFASNIGALGLLAATQPIAWGLGLTMGVCALAGAQAGSRLAVREGARIIRPLMVLACCAMAIKLLSDPANPLRRALTLMLHP